MAESEKEYYTWNAFGNDAKALAARIKKDYSKKFRNIYGIPRGGLVVAVALSHHLGLPLVLSREDITPQTLIVDDIADSGHTLAHLVEQLGYRPTIATLYAHPESKVVPNAFARTKDSWVIFPWETDASSKYDGTV